MKLGAMLKRQPRELTVQEKAEYILVYGYQYSLEVARHLLKVYRAQVSDMVADKCGPYTVAGFIRDRLEKLTRKPAR